MSCVTCPEKVENQIKIQPVKIPNLDGVFFDKENKKVTMSNETWKLIVDYFVNVDAKYQEINTIQHKLVIDIEPEEIK